jgi:hypothetical protein
MGPTDRGIWEYEGEGVVTEQDLTGMLMKMAAAGRRRLTFDEVRAAGKPAVYRKFGDHLLYVGGRLFDVSEPDAPVEVGMTPAQAARESVAAERAVTVGIEYGWRHEADCPCSFCERSNEAA